MTYNNKTCDGIAGNPDFYNVTSRTASMQHNVDSFVRSEDRLRLLARAQAMYQSGGQAPPVGAPTQNTSLASHTTGVVRSPQTFLTCIGRMDPNAGVTMRSRCYTMLEPGTAWPGAYNGPVLALTPQVYHNITRGTIGGGGVTTLTTEFFGFTCFPAVPGRLWIRAEHSITLDKVTTAGDTDIGDFRIYVYENSTCTPPEIRILTGSNPSDPNNETLTHLAASSDLDGDSCEDNKELATNQVAGGLRDPMNKWDFFDPNKSGGNDVDDIFFLAARFALTVGHPMYTQNADRNSPPRAFDADGVDDPDNAYDGPGPSAWNLRGPNGAIDVDDIFTSTASFANVC
jgi:hypothetical protein